MNSSQRQELFEDILGEFGFRVRFSYESHWTDVEAWEIVGRDENDKPLLRFNGEKTERYLHGYIKWDGCSEFEFDPDGNGNGYDFHW